MAVDVKSRAKRYEKLDFLGEGQFATVYKARDKNTPTKLFEISELFFTFCFAFHLGINRTALREITLLQELSHPTIIGVSHAMSCFWDLGPCPFLNEVDLD
uniref:Protein kinase domain-containing protein n=1 Tax=Canis lupus familiaris TaxID=9615 RepID=A0A8C0NQ60_CANLF